MMTRKPIWTALAVLLAAGTAAADDRQQSASDLVPIGAAEIDITPEVPVRMYGYASRTTESAGVAGRLFAKALAIGGDSGEGPAVLLCVDNGDVPTRIRDEVFRRVGAKTRIKLERFVLANAHIHSGPRMSGYDAWPPEQRKHILRYAERLTDRLEQVVLEALRKRKPGRLAWARGKVGFAANRRVLKDGKWVGFGAVLDGPVDHTLLLLRATDAEGNLLAVVANYACHCTTLRANFQKIHGDWGGSAQRMIQADHPGAVAMISIGCGADADPHPHGTVELCDRHGRELADEVKRLLAGPMTPIEPKLTACRVTLELPYQDPAQGEKVDKQRPPLQYPIVAWIFDDDLAMVFLSSEVVVDYALRMRREMDGSRLWITAYAHDVMGYVVSRRILQEGGYERNNSLSARISRGHPQDVQPPMEDRIIDAVRKLLPEGFHRPRPRR